jgi:hypothetical protein
MCIRPALFEAMSLKLLLLVIALIFLVLAFFIRRYRQSSPHLNVEPQAAREIEKAKRAR